MNKRKRNNNKFWTIILCVLTVTMVGLIVGIVFINASRLSNQSSEESHGSGGQADNYMAGTAEPIGLDDGENGDSSDGGESGESADNNSDGSSEQGDGGAVEDKERIQGWLTEAEAVRNGFDGMTLEDALAYIEQKASEKDNLDDAFNIRLIKVNVLYYYEMYQEALAELTRVEHPEELTLWNQEEYYNMMYMVSLKLGDEEAAEEYARMWREVNYKRTGGPAGVED